MDLVAYLLFYLGKRAWRKTRTYLEHFSDFLEAKQSIID